MAGLVSWGFSSRRFSAGPLKLPPPIIGCTVVGKTWEVFINYGIAGPSGQLSEVVFFDYMSPYLYTSFIPST